MIRSLTLLTLILLLASGCAGGGADSDTESTANIGATTDSTEATTAKESSVINESTEAAEDVTLEQLVSGAMGPERRQILVASSAQDLATATGLEVPNAREGTYVAVSWGEKSTGGYTVDFGSASVEGTRVTVNVELKDPPPDAMVAQVITYPYAAAVLEGVDPGEKEFVFVTKNGRELGWPIRSV